VVNKPHVLKHRSERADANSGDPHVQLHGATQRWLQEQSLGRLWQRTDPDRATGASRSAMKSNTGSNNPTAACGRFYDDARPDHDDTTIDNSRDRVRAFTARPSRSCSAFKPDHTAGQLGPHKPPQK
jgi:hypothetical protein